MMSATAMQTLCLVHDETQVGAARRKVRSVAEAASLDEVRTGHAAIIATELASNMLKHAGGGELLVQIVEESSFRGIELIAVDRGPGIRNVRLSMEDGHSTGGTPGTGLGAARRLSTVFDLFSEPERGTVVLSRIGSLHRSQTAVVRWGSVASNAPGELVSGDQWAIAFKDDVLSLMLVDGLGHGLLAHEAAAQAVRVFIAHSTEPPASILKRMHVALRSSRGGAIAVARCNLQTGEVVYAGIGNVAGVLVRKDGQQNGLVSNNGTVGADQISAKEFKYEWKPGEVLVMHTDGLQTRWSVKDRPGLAACHPAIIAALLHRDYLRGRDDATVVALSR